MQTFGSTMRHTVVVSDVHLWEALPGEGLWMRYRQRRFFPDDRLAAMLDLVASRAGTDPLEVVFNGDVFDFDVAPVQGDGLDYDARCVSEEEAIARLTAILDDHPVFVGAVGKVLAKGGSIVFVAGNHDVQLHWPKVRALLEERILDAATCGRELASEARDAMRTRILFRAWFHRTADGILVEHGNQYDRYCSFASPLAPFVTEGELERIEPTVGSLVVHHIVGRLGYFNPNHDPSFLLSAAGYAKHFFRYYAFAKESLVGTWTLGTIRVALSLLDHSRRRRRLDDEALTRFADERGIGIDALREHAAMSKRAGVHEFLRTLQLDKAALAGVVVAATALALAHPRTALGFMLGSVGALTAFNLAVKEKSLSETYDHLRECQRRIARLYGARAVVFGHTHEAFGRWEEGTFYGNCGTWSPRHHDVECNMPFEHGDPFVWLRSDDGGRLRGGLYRFVDGQVFAADDDARETLTPQAPAMLTEAVSAA
jgi:UDP-2,3-diacylglucosamine pyrophosphatase LpxH